MNCVHGVCLLFIVCVIPACRAIDNNAPEYYEENVSCLAGADVRSKVGNRQVVARSESDGYGEVVVLKDTVAEGFLIGYTSVTGDLDVLHRKFNHISIPKQLCWYLSTCIILAAESVTDGYDTIIQIDSLGSGIVVYSLEELLTSDYEVYATGHGRAWLSIPNGEASGYLWIADQGMFYRPE